MEPSDMASKESFATSGPEKSLLGSTKKPQPTSDPPQTEVAGDAHATAQQVMLRVSMELALEELDLCGSQEQSQWYKQDCRDTANSIVSLMSKSTDSVLSHQAKQFTIHKIKAFYVLVHVKASLNETVNKLCSQYASTASVEEVMQSVIPLLETLFPKNEEEGQEGDIYERLSQDLNLDLSQTLSTQLTDTITNSLAPPHGHHTHFRKLVEEHIQSFMKNISTWLHQQKQIPRHQDPVRKCLNMINTLASGMTNPKIHFPDEPMSPETPCPEEELKCTPGKTTQDQTPSPQTKHTIQDTIISTEFCEEESVTPLCEERSKTEQDIVRSTMDRLQENQILRSCHPCGTEVSGNGKEPSNTAQVTESAEPKAQSTGPQTSLSSDSNGEPQPATEETITTIRQILEQAILELEKEDEENEGLEALLSHECVRTAISIVSLMTDEKKSSTESLRTNKDKRNSVIQKIKAFFVLGHAKATLHKSLSNLSCQYSSTGGTASVEQLMQSASPLLEKLIPEDGDEGQEADLYERLSHDLSLGHYQELSTQLTHTIIKGLAAPKGNRRRCRRQVAKHIQSFMENIYGWLHLQKQKTRQQDPVWKCMKKIHKQVSRKNPPKIHFPEDRESYSKDRQEVYTPPKQKSLRQKMDEVRTSPQNSEQRVRRVRRVRSAGLTSANTIPASVPDSSTSEMPLPSDLEEESHLTSPLKERSHKGGQDLSPHQSLHQKSDDVRTSPQDSAARVRRTRARLASPNTGNTPSVPEGRTSEARLASSEKNPPQPDIMTDAAATKQSHKQGNYKQKTAKVKDEPTQEPKEDGNWNKWEKYNLLCAVSARVLQTEDHTEVTEFAEGLLEESLKQPEWKIKVNPGKQTIKDVAYFVHKDLCHKRDANRVHHTAILVPSYKRVILESIRKNVEMPRTTLTKSILSFLKMGVMTLLYHAMKRSD